MTRRTLPLPVVVLIVVAGGVAPAAPQDDDNAAAFYRQAFAVLPDTSNPEWAILEKPDALKLDDTAVKFITSHDPTFELLRKGAMLRRCDWATDPAQGTQGKSPHLQPARTLANLTRLRARLLVQQRRHAEAMDDVVAVLTLSRHVGSEPFVISKLTEAGIAGSAVAAAAQGLASAPPEVARTLMDKLERLPASLAAGDVVRREGEALVAQLRRSPGGALANEAAAREAAALFEDAAKFLALPFEDSFVPAQKWETRLQAAPPEVRERVPSLRAYRIAVAAAETKVEMLYAAAAVRVDGAGEVFRFREPHAKGSFTCRELAGGFELESKLVVDNLPLKLTCRPSGDELPF